MGDFFSRKVGNSAVDCDVAEIDELYHFLGKRARTETKENIYIIPITSRNPRQFLGIIASKDKSPQTIENLLWDSPLAKQYYTDGYLGYREICYPGKFKFNSVNKNDTFTAESGNADLRCYIAQLKRRSRCFPRKLDNLNATLKLFAHAYSLFGQWKSKYCQILVKHKSSNPSKKLRKFRYPSISHLDFIGH